MNEGVAYFLGIALLVVASAFMPPLLAVVFLYVLLVHYK